MHFYAWKKGLKTGMYYLRTRPAVDAIKFTVDQQALLKTSTPTPTATTPEVATIESSTATTPSVEAVIPSANSTPQEEEPEDDEALVCRREEGCMVCGS